MLLIPTSAIIQEAELCVSQLPPYEQSITVSAPLQSALAPFFFHLLTTMLCFQKTMLAGRTAIHCIPQLTVQTCFLNQQQHLAAPPIGIRHT